MSVSVVRLALWIDVDALAAAESATGDCPFEGLRRLGPVGMAFAAKAAAVAVAGGFGLARDPATAWPAGAFRWSSLAGLGAVAVHAATGMPIWLWTGPGKGPAAEGCLRVEAASTGGNGGRRPTRDPVRGGGPARGSSTGRRRDAVRASRSTC